MLIENWIIIIIIIIYRSVLYFIIFGHWRIMKWLTANVCRISAYFILWGIDYSLIVSTCLYAKWFHIFAIVSKIITSSHIFVCVCIYLCFRSIIPSSFLLCLSVCSSLHLCSCNSHWFFSFPAVFLYFLFSSIFPSFETFPALINYFTHIIHFSFNCIIHHSIQSSLCLFVCLAHIIASKFITYSCHFLIFALSIPSSCFWLTIFTLTSHFVNWLFRKILDNYKIDAISGLVGKIIIRFLVFYIIF